LAQSKLNIEDKIKVNGKNVTKGEYPGSKSINPTSGAIQSVSVTLPLLAPPAFPSFTGGTNLTSPSTVAAGTYGTITVNNGSNSPDTVFNGGTYYLDSLIIKSSASVQLGPGDYFIKTQLTMASLAKLTILPEGTVRFYLNSSQNLLSNLSINEAGKAGHLQFYLYPNANGFKTANNATLNGIVYATGSRQNIEIGEDSIITGKLISMNLVLLKNNTVINYSATTQTETDSISTCQSGVVGGDISPASFNCIESSADTPIGTLYTKLAGTSFGFDVLALKTDGTIETGYAANSNKNVTVELVDGSGSTTCSSRTALSPAVAQTLTFTAADAGRKTSTAMTVANAYPDLRCRVTDNNQSPSIVGCSGDNFSVRPSSFVISSNMTADNAGLSSNATPTAKSGVYFTLSAASNTAGYNGSPLIDGSKLSAHYGGVQNGLLSGSFAAADATTGVASGNTFSYSEAGYFLFAANGVYDDAFTAVDAANNDCSNDFSNTAVSGKYGCKFGNTAPSVYFGRFVPDHFALTQGLSTPACGNAFTYFGQDGFTTTFTLTAENASNSLTQNYTGSFAKLSLTDWANYNFTSVSLPAGSLLAASSTAPSGTWSNGSASISAKHQINRPTTLAGETSISVLAAPVDSDSVSMVASQVAPATPLRYGRINLNSTHGSELLDLNVPMLVEYFNGTEFIANPLDVCSVATLTLTDPVLSDALNTTDTCIWDDSSTSGSNRCTTTSPAGNSYQEAASLSSGSFNLNLKATLKTGALNLTADVADWLKFNWQGAGNTNPSARITFGIYKGHQKLIYFHEIY
jgi:hypothetical protein